MARRKAERGEDPPEGYANRPQPEGIFELEAWAAYSVLSEHRGSGLTGPIRVEYRDLISYLDEELILEEDDRDFVRQCVAAMDDEYMDWVVVMKEQNKQK